MERKDYIPTEDHQKSFDDLRNAIKNDLKFAYALHSSLLAKKMRSWGYAALKYLPKKSRWVRVELDGRISLWGL